MKKGLILGAILSAGLLWLVDDIRHKQPENEKTKAGKAATSRPKRISMVAVANSRRPDDSVWHPLTQWSFIVGPAITPQGGGAPSMVAHVFFEDGSRSDFDGGRTSVFERSSCPGTFRCRWTFDTPDGYFGIVVEDLPWPWWPHNQYVMAAIVNGDGELDQKRAAAIERRMRTWMTDTRLAMVPDKGFPRIDLVDACNSDPCTDEEAMYGTLQIAPVTESQ